MPKLIKQNNLKDEAWFIYVLLCRDGSLYTGSTNDVEKRFLAHRLGKGGKYTRSHPVARIVYQERHPNKSAALRREAEIKRWRRWQKVEKLHLV